MFNTISFKFCDFLVTIIPLNLFGEVLVNFIQ